MIEYKLPRMTVNSPLFGKTELASDEEYTVIYKLSKECPVSVFGALNNYLNSKGLCLHIDELK